MLYEVITTVHETVSEGNYVFSRNSIVLGSNVAADLGGAEVGDSVKVLVVDRFGEDQIRRFTVVITSYSIHYTKLYDGVAVAPPGPHPGGAGDVDPDQHGQLPLFPEDLDVRVAGARGDVPVDVADVVAEHVLAQIREIEPVAAKQRPVVAVQHAVEPTDDSYNFV